MGKKTTGSRDVGGRISYRLFGFGFWQAWWVLAMCSDIVLPGRSMSDTLFNPFFCITILTTVSYLFVVLLSKRFGPFSNRRVFYVLAGGLATIGSFGLSSFTLVSYPNDFFLLFVVFAAVFSVGNALLLIMWGELWSTLATGRVGRYLYASYAFAFVLYFAVSALPHGVASVITCLFPALSAIILRSSQHEPKRSPSHVDFEVESFSPVKIAVAVVAIGAVHGFVQRYLNVSGTVPGTTIAYSLAIAGTAILLLVVYLVVVQPAAEPFALYKPILPSFAIGLMLLAILPGEFAFVGNGLMLLAIYSVDMLVMLVSTDIAFRTRKPVALCFGLALFGMRLGTTFASASVYLLTVSDALSPETSFIAYLICAMIVVAVGSLVFTQVDLMKLYKPKPMNHAGQGVTENCRRISEACGLTPRESEVLGLLAEGRSAPYISGELCIAESTVKHHISSIYRKIGIYDRQSLMDVVLQGMAGKGAL